MWGRFWNNLYKDLVPFPNKPSLDPTEEMIKQNYTVRKMFETGDNFYASMGLYRVPDTFYDLSMLEKPAGYNFTNILGAPLTSRIFCLVLFGG
jgi:peptidyl-dipeptidase A